MPEGSYSTLHQGPMGEESARLSSPLSACEHVRGASDDSPGPGFCYGRLCSEPLDGDGERPVSLVSTLSSGSSRDSHSLFGSTAALLPSSFTEHHQHQQQQRQQQQDIDLDLSPAGSTGDQSPTLAGSRARWRERLEARLINSLWNNNNQAATTAAKRKSEAPHVPSSPVVTDAMAPNPKLTYVDRVVMEIIETERMYVMDLRSIVEDYLAHIIDLNNLPIRPEQVGALFGNIEDIYEFNSELLQSLDMCENDPVAIARCFVDKREYFEIYTQYCTNYPNSVAALTDCMRSKTLAKFFRERQAALQRSLPLGSYLLKPVQRILKYHLLLQEIAKHFDPDEEGDEVVQEAIDTMTGVAWYINDMKRKHEHAVRVQEIQSLLINWKGCDLTTYGELVLEGTFHVLRAKNTRTLFLFQKTLLITKKRGEHYVYKTHISCSTLMLLDSAKDPLLFSVIHFKHPKQPHTVQAKSVEEKRLWAHHIKRLILENHNAIVPQTAKEAVLDNSNFPGKYHYSPERLKKAESCQDDDFYRGSRNERRRSEPAKQIRRSSKAVLKHADSEGALLGDRRSLQPASSVSTLASDLGEAQAERPCVVEDLVPRRDCPEQLSPTDSEPTLGSSSPGEGGLQLEKEDVLMGDDQDEQSTDSELIAAPGEELETCGEEEKHTDDAVKETVTAKVNIEELCLANCVPQALTCDQPPEVCPSECPESPVSPPPQEAGTPEPQDTSRETGEEEDEGGSDSSGLQAGETSVLSEEEDELLAENRSILPSSVLDQASVIAEHFVGTLSRRSSLVSEDLGSLACPSPSIENDPFKSPSACMDLEEQSQMLAGSLPEEQGETPESNLSTPVNEPTLNGLVEAERRSTLSKQDRLLIHKIRRYYERAEHQDENFSIKRRESLSYIPAGLVQHLSRQLNSAPQQQAGQVNRKGLLRNRPSSWSVFDLPGLSRNSEGRQKSEAQRPEEARVGSQRNTNGSITEEEFRPASDMVQVWQDMELESEENGLEVLQIAEEKLSDSRLELTQEMSSHTSERPPPILEESDLSIGSDCSSISSPTTPLAAVDGQPCNHSNTHRTPLTEEKGHFSQSNLPKIINFRTSIDEDQILQDMGKMKNKVFQLARQYSQRIKNNRPMIKQRNRDTASQLSFRNMPVVHEGAVQLRKNGKPSLRLPLNTCDQAVIHEESSLSPLHSPGSCASSQSTVTSPQSPQSEGFHWPDVQELRTKYTKTPGPSKVTRSRTVPNGMLEYITNRSNGCSHKYKSSSDLDKAVTERARTQSEAVDQEEDWPQPRPQPPLCRWSSLDHMLGSLPLHQVQNLQEPIRTGHTTSHSSLRSRDTGKLRDGDSHLVRSLREKFQSLGTNL